MFLEELHRLQMHSHLSGSHRHFSFATIEFVEGVSGIRPRTFYDAIQQLRDLAKHRNQQHKHLYEEINRLRNEISDKSIAIACLANRHVLENLPKGKTDILSTKLGLSRREQDDLKAATPRWKATWELAVQEELRLMISDVKQSRPAASCPSASKSGSTRTAQAPNPPSRPLTALLRGDFDQWAGSKAGKTYCQAFTPGDAIPRKSMPYEGWPSYRRGLDFYSETSANIHGYGKAYDTKDGTWMKSDALIFEWLKPKTTMEDGTVDWKNEWRARGLPEAITPVARSPPVAEPPIPKPPVEDPILEPTSC